MVSTITLYGQEAEIELEKAYLDSLPEAVKADVLKEIKTKKEEDSQQTYRRPSTSLNKYETVKEWERFLRESKIEPSERFGSQVFRSMQSSFMPINEPNFDSSYIIDYGDKLEIQLSGQKNKKYTLNVERDGSINLPDIEKIVIAGLSTKQAFELINSKVENLYLGTKALTTLKEIRDIQILVTGEAAFPGIYTLSGNTNVLHALNVAGGIKENGSYREIIVKRNGKALYSLDLYDVLISGDISFIQNLRSGDTVLVNSAKKIVRVSGAGVNRQAKYELKDRETLADLIQFANGYSYNSSTEEMIFETINKNKFESKVLGKLDLESIFPESGSSLYVPANLFREVELTGRVKRPGKYTIYDGETLSSLIKRSGGYKDNAYPFGGVLLRQSVKEIDKEMHDRVYKELIRSMLSNQKTQQSQQSFQGIGALLMEIKDNKPSGRMQTEFDLLKLRDDDSLDITLENKDKIHIPHMNRVVYVYGEVQNPGPVIYEPGEDFEYYLEKSGGFAYFADKKYSIAIAPDGSAKKINIGLLSRDDVMFYPGSFIYVPKKIAHYDAVSLVSVVSPIFSSFALSLASINALND